MRWVLMADVSAPSPGRLSSGVAGLDDILHGGLAPNRLYLIEGMPGSGKTTLGLQFLLAGLRHGEPGLYLTLAESEEELRTAAGSHGWSLDGLAFRDLAPEGISLDASEQYTMFHPSEVELKIGRASCRERER